MNRRSWTMTVVLLLVFMTLIAWVTLEPARAVVLPLVFAFSFVGTLVFWVLLLSLNDNPRYYWPAGFAAILVSLTLAYLLVDMRPLVIGIWYHIACAISLLIWAAGIKDLGERKMELHWENSVVQFLFHPIPSAMSGFVCWGYEKPCCMVHAGIAAFGGLSFSVGVSALLVNTYQSKVTLLTIGVMTYLVSGAAHLGLMAWDVAHESEFAAKKR